MDTVRDILTVKGNLVHCVTPNAYVLDALKIMADHDVGAVVVRSGSLPVGLFGEREHARSMIVDRRARMRHVKEVMLADVPCVEPNEAIDHCMEVMTRTRVRHLPVIEGCSLVGLVSIGDIVRAAIAEREYRIGQLHHYISGVPC